MCFIPDKHCRARRLIMKLEIAYHASLEQFAPSELLGFACLAIESGFESINCSDHFHPWNSRQGHSGYAWSWLPASMSRLQAINHSVVCAPGQRYHPAIIAQAAATIVEMFGNHLAITFGTGQALNELITGEGWPAKSIRADRLAQCVRVIKQLWNGDTVSETGHIRVNNARLYTLPQKHPQIFGAALTEETAAWVGSWADGLTTTGENLDELRKKITAFKTSGGEHKPIWVKLDVSYAKTYADSLKNAHDQWWTNTFGSPLQSELSSPAAFELASKNVLVGDMAECVLVGTSYHQFIQRLKEIASLGAERVIVHNVGRNQKEFIEFWRAEVIPKLYD